MEWVQPAKRGLEMDKGKIVSIEDRIPKLKHQRRKKANRRLIVLLALFFILIAGVIYFQSPLSKVKNITVSGNHSYDNDQIVNKSGISLRTNVWQINRDEAEKELESIQEVKNATVKVNLPNTVEIKINEYKRLAYISKGKNFYPVLENGNILGEKKIDEIPVNAPILIGFKEGKVLDEMIASLEDLPEVVINSISEVHSKPAETDRFLIKLYMNDGFEVNASLRTFSEKMAHYPSIVSQLDPAKKGVIDLEVGSYFKAYEAEEAEEVEIEKESEQ
jgi:cell division protein FtsQ